MPTIKEVAQRAGVSVSCVSKYLNHPNNVLPQTKERIDAAIAELHYIPSNMARSLRTKRTLIVAAVMESITNPFFAALFDHIRRTMENKGYTTVLQTFSKSVYRSTDFSLADGILICFPDREEHIDQIRKAAKHKPLVLVHGREVARDVPSVIVRVGQGSRLAVEHLMQQGCRDYVAVCGPADSSMTLEKTGAIADAFARSEAKTTLSILHVPNNVEGGLSAGAMLVDRRIDAILCDSDALAYGIISRLTEAGVHIPQDVRVVGYDDILLSKMYAPPLTTVAIPSEQICAAACEMLLRAIENQPVENAWFDPELVVRQTT